MSKSGISYIADEIRFAFKDAAYWLGNRKDDLMYHVRGVSMGIDNIIRDIRYRIDMAVPSMQDYAAKSERLSRLADKTQTAYADAEAMIYKARNAFTPEISEIKPGEEPEILRKMRAVRRAQEAANAIDAEIIEEPVAAIAYKP